MIAQVFPKDIRMKTNSQLQKNVMDDIGWEPSTTAAQIGVTAANGVVTLTAHKDDKTVATAIESGKHIPAAGKKA
jgi:hypothetical protein